MSSKKNEVVVKSNETTHKDFSFADFSKNFSFAKVGKTGNGDIYQSKVFSDCVTEKDKKARRIKLRKMRDNFIESFFDTKNKNNKNEIISQWKEFAEGVYKDVNIIFSGQTSDDKAILFSKFLQEIKSK